jgi:hypothetical protein
MKKKIKRLPLIFRHEMKRWLARQGMVMGWVGVKNADIIKAASDILGITPVGSKYDQYVQVFKATGFYLEPRQVWIANPDKEGEPIPVSWTLPSEPPLMVPVSVPPGITDDEMWNAAPSQKHINEFYDSWEWKRLRYDYLKGRGRQCQCCNALAYDGAKIVVDHIKPIRRFWHLRLDPKNLQLLCEDCNMGKGSRDETHWHNAGTI